jgi:hypothetical protein
MFEYGRFDQKSDGSSQFWRLTIRGGGHRELNEVTHFRDRETLTARETKQPAESGLFLLGSAP